MDTAAFDLSVEQDAIVQAAKEFGEKWAATATDIDRFDDAPAREMIEDTVDLGLAG